MIVQAKYEETEDFSVLISMPDTPEFDILQKQEAFFKWLFDVNIDHQYWRTINGKKNYCEYGIDAFVWWLNEEVFSETDEKAQVISREVETHPEISITIYF